MCQVNMHEAKSNLSKFIRMLENGQEDIIYIARDGKPIAQMTLIHSAPTQRRIDVAKGKITVPDEFDDWDSEIEELFGSAL